MTQLAFCSIAFLHLEFVCFLQGISHSQTGASYFRFKMCFTSLMCVKIRDFAHGFWTWMLCESDLKRKTMKKKKSLCRVFRPHGRIADTVLGSASHSPSYEHVLWMGSIITTLIIPSICVSQCINDVQSMQSSFVLVSLLVSTKFWDLRSLFLHPVSQYGWIAVSSPNALI